MRAWLVTWVTLFFSLGCPQATTPTNPPDAADAGVVGPSLDATAFGDAALTPCQAACLRLSKEGCPTLADCPAVYSDMERDHLRPKPDHTPLTCMDIVTARALTDVGLRCP